MFPEKVSNKKSFKQQNFQIRNQKVSNRELKSFKLCLFETFNVSCKEPSLPKVSNKHEISQSLILGHVTTVSTNQKAGNSQIL